MNFLRRQDYLQAGRVWSLAWKRNGQPCGDIRGVTVDDGQIVLIYRHRRNGGPWEDVRQPVQLVYTACNYGGRRPWFICPGVVRGVPCRRRVGKLFAGGKYFLCRHCYGLAYQSQREDEADRLLTKAQAIRKRLGGSGSSMESFPWKPKGMHWKTYSRLYEQAREAEQVSLRLTAVRFGLF